MSFGLFSVTNVLRIFSCHLDIVLVSFSLGIWWQGFKTNRPDCGIFAVLVSRNASVVMFIFVYMHKLLFMHWL